MHFFFFIVFLSLNETYYTLPEWKSQLGSEPSFTLHCYTVNLFSWYSNAINQAEGPIKCGQGGSSSTCLCTTDLPL